jgi:hypothetical protein
MLPPLPYELTPPLPSSTTVASPNPSETTKETETESNSCQTKEQANIPSTRISNANPSAKPGQAEVYSNTNPNIFNPNAADNSNPNNNASTVSTACTTDANTADSHNYSTPNTSIHNHKSDRKRNHPFDPGGINISKCNFVHDPGSNGLKTEDSALRNEDDVTSNQASTGSDNASCPANDLDCDHDKIASVTLNVKSVCDSMHTDCPISEATPSHPTTKLPAFLYLDKEHTNAAGLPPATRINSDSDISSNGHSTVNATCTFDINNTNIANSCNNNSSSSNINATNTTSAVSSAHALNALNAVTMTALTSDTNNATITNSSNSSIVNIDPHINIMDTATKTSTNSNNNSNTHSSSDDTTGTSSISVITGCITAHTFSTSSPDLNTVTSNSSNSKCSDAANNSNVDNGSSNEPEYKCPHTARTPPFNINREVPLFVAPFPDKPEELSPAHPIKATHSPPHWTHANSQDAFHFKPLIPPLRI